MTALALALAFIAGGVIGYKVGWNGALRMIRDRDIARARERYEADRK